MKKRILFLLVLSIIFSLILIKAKESPASTIFYIESCQIPMRDGSTIYLVTGGCYQGVWYCADASTNRWYDTTKEHCEGLDEVPDVGKGSLEPHDDCCPEGTACKTAGGACTETQASCSSITEQTQCEANACLWLDSKCIHPLGMTSCSDYGTNQQACTVDPVKLGVANGRGLGTEICGKTIGEYIVLIESCNCSFDAANNKCVFSYSTKTVVGGQDYIECKKSYLVTECTLGKQALSWEAVIAPPEKAGEAAAQEQCASGSKQVSCGRAIEKIPFFSWINLIFAAAIILVIYLMIVFLSSKHSVKSHKRLHKHRRR